MARDWLSSEHPIYATMKQTWMRLERRLAGGEAVAAELARFDWETVDGEHYRRRQAQASYPEFPGIYAETVGGHLFRQAPEPGGGLNFGALGEVRRQRAGSDPTRAELVWFNADGAGQDGSQWDGFWARATKHAMGTGHRWIFVESPTGRAESGEDEIRGLRPYLVDLSPLSVTNWEYTDGQLAFAIVKRSTRRLRLRADGALEGNTPEDQYLFMVRRGYDAFGAEYAGGGWWLYNADREPVTADGGRAVEGTWERTLGEIPLTPYFYERSAETFSRSGTYALGQLAVGYMNMDSAADFDAWDAAMSLLFIVGVDQKGFNLIDAKLREGSRHIPVIANATTGQMPSVHDGSHGAVTAEVFQLRLKAKAEQAREISIREATSTPDSSGVSKMVGFAEQKSPRLRLQAEELETAQNAVLRFLELRFGMDNPSAEVAWPREFALKPLIDDIERQIEMERVSGYKSPTLGGRMMTLAARENQLIADDDTARIVEAEYTAAAVRARDRADALGDALGGLGVGEDGRTDPEPPAPGTRPDPPAVPET